MMRRVLVLAALLCACTQLLLADSTVTANIRTLGNTAVTQRAYLQWTLMNCSRAPTLIGTTAAAIDATRSTQKEPNASGVVNVTLARSDTEISCDGAFNSYFRFEIISGGRVVWTKSVRLVDAVVDLATVPAIAVDPPGPPSQYAKLSGPNVFTGVQDFSNASVIGVTAATPVAIRRFYPAESCDGSRTTFTFGATPPSGIGFQFFWNGMLLNDTDDYALAGAVVTLVRPCKTGDKIWAYF